MVWVFNCLFFYEILYWGWRKLQFYFCIHFININKVYGLNTLKILQFVGIWIIDNVENIYRVFFVLFVGLDSWIDFSINLEVWGVFWYFFSFKKKAYKKHKKKQGIYIEKPQNFPSKIKLQNPSTSKRINPSSIPVVNFSNFNIIFPNVGSFFLFKKKLKPK